MIDFGLLMSIIIGFGAPALLANWWPLTGDDEAVGFLDVALGPAFAGLVIGRLTTLALDDPSSIGSISDMLIIRSGVEFWPGVAAAVMVVGWGAHRAGASPLARVAELAPLAMVGYAGYEAACVFRDGCFGPRTALGLRPPGLTTTMLPVGWLMALTVVAGAFLVRRLILSGRVSIAVSSAALIVAAVRAVGSIWLPHVGVGPTRQHLTSVVVAIAAMVMLTGVISAARRRHSVASPSA